MKTNNNPPRFIIVHSTKFNGHYDILDTQTGQREPTSTTSLRWLRYEVDEKNRNTSHRR